MNINSNRFLRTFGIALCATGIVCSAMAHAEDSTKSNWLQFRGPKASGVSESATIPAKFGAESNENITWKTKLPGRSVCGPIIVGNQVISSSSDGIDQRRIHLISVDSDSGKVLWHQEFVARGRPFCHPTSANAAPTPASDGKNIYALYSSNDLVCVDLQGDLVWYRSLTSVFPKAGNDVGMSSSPLVVDGVVVVQVECQGDSFVAGLDATNGSILWKNDRPKLANWASPTAVTLPSGQQVAMIQSMKDLVALTPKSGKPVWSLDVPCSTIPSMLAVDNRLLVPSGGLTAFDLSSAAEPSKLWSNNKMSSNACSPVVAKERVFTISRTTLNCADLYSGEVKWQLRLPNASQIWSSPVIAGNTLYVFTMDGKCFAVKIDGDQGEILETNSLEEEVLGSPAISGNAMYVRGVTHLWKISKK